MKLTRHNGRAGKNGVYNPKHNDRSFDIANSEHIDEERAKQNLYWDCYNGFRNFKNPEKENELSATFEDVEQLFYRQRYRDFVTGQNERNVKNRHPERNKETGDLLKSKKTCPEETVYQIGTLDNHVPPELLIEIVTEFMEIANERFGSHVHILNWALHLDESTPHIHERHSLLSAGGEAVLPNRNRLAGAGRWPLSASPYSWCHSARPDVQYSSYPCPVRG